MVVSLDRGDFLPAVVAAAGFHFYHFSSLVTDDRKPSETKAQERPGRHANYLNRSSPTLADSEQLRRHKMIEGPQIV